MTHIPALDGVRGLAVAAVVVFHCGASTWLPGGFLGVSLFFTLSGYLITSLILAEVDATGRLALGQFWARRVRRLVPALLLTLVAVAVGQLIVTFPDRTAGEVIGGLTYSSNWLAIGQHASYADLFSAPSPLAHLWSLAIEEQIYIAVPLLIWWVCRHRAASLRRWLTVGSVLVVGASIGAALGSSNTTTIYYGTHTRAGELAAGVLLAVVVPFGAAVASRRATVTGAIGLIGSALLWRSAGIGDAWLYLGGLTACALLSAAVIDAAMRPGVVSSLLSASPLCALGKISYGLYLFHWPVTVLISPTRFPVSDTELFIARVALSLALAFASARWLERPLRRGVDHRPARLVGASAVGLFGAGAVGALLIGSLTPSAAVEVEPTVRVFAPSAPTPAGAAPVSERFDGGASAVQPSEPSVTGGDASRELARAEEPARSSGGGGGAVRVAVFGDSVPNWLVRDGATALASRSIELRDATIEGCDGAVGMPVGRSGSGVELPILPTCRQWTEWYGEVLVEETDVAVLAVGPGVVVDRLLNGTWVGPCDQTMGAWYRDDIVARLREMQADATRVVLVLPAWATDQSRWINPDDHVQRMECVRAALTEAGEIVAGDGSLTVSVTGVQGTDSAQSSVQIVDLGAFLCPGGPSACRDVRRADGVHIDPEAAVEVLGWLLDQITALPPTSSALTGG